MVWPVVKYPQGANRAVEGNAFFGQQRPYRRFQIPASHAKAGERRSLKISPRVKQGAQALAQQLARQAVCAGGRALPFGLHVRCLLSIIEGRGAPVVQMGGDFCVVVVAHPGQMTAGLGIGKNRVRAKQRQRKTQFAGERGKPAQQGHVAHAAACGCIIAGKKSLFFNIQAHNNTQGGFVVAEGAVGGIVAMSHQITIIPRAAYGNAQGALLLDNRNR